MNKFYNIRAKMNQAVSRTYSRENIENMCNGEMISLEIEEDTEENNFLLENDCRKAYQRKLMIRNYLKKLFFLYILNICGYLYLHFIRLSHNYEGMDFSIDDFIFFFLLPLFCLFPINHLLSKNEYKHYGTYFLGYFNGINFSFLNSIGNLDKFVLDTNNFKGDDAFHIFILVILILFCVYSVGYTLYVTKKRKLVALLILSPIIIIGILCMIMTSRGYIIHIHHYLIGIFLVFVSYHPKYMTIIINSVSFGVYFEGIVQWGYAPIFYKKK